MKKLILMLKISWWHRQQKKYSYIHAVQHELVTLYYKRLLEEEE